MPPVLAIRDLRLAFKGWRGYSYDQIPSYDD